LPSSKEREEPRRSRIKSDPLIRLFQETETLALSVEGASKKRGRREKGKKRQKDLR